MRSGFKHFSRGYSLTELLVVVAIIGILSLIGVPAFLNYQRGNYIKTGLRQLTHDLRSARMYAVTHSVWVRVEFETTQATPHQYYFFSSTDNGTTWTALTLPTTYGASAGTGPVLKTFNGPVWVESTSNVPDQDGDGKPDVVYMPNGQLWFNAPVTATTNTAANLPTLVLATSWTQIQFNRYSITCNPAGTVTSTGWHT